MFASGDMADDPHIEGLVGQNQLSRLVAAKLPVYLRIGRVAADEPMAAIEYKDITQARNRWRSVVRGEGTLLGWIDLIVQRDLVEFSDGEGGVFDLDACVGEFDQFGLQFGKSPMTFLSQPVQSQSHNALLGHSEMRHTNTRDRSQAQLFGRFDGCDAIEDTIVLVDEDRGD